MTHASLKILCAHAHALVAASAPKGIYVINADLVPVCRLAIGEGTMTAQTVGHTFSVSLWRRCSPTCTFGNEDAAPCQNDHRYVFFAIGETPDAALALFTERWNRYQEEGNATQARREREGLEGDAGLGTRGEDRAVPGTGPAGDPGGGEGGEDRPR